MGFNIGYVDFLNLQGLQKSFLDSGHKLNLYFCDTKEQSDDFICSNPNTILYNGDLEGLYKNSDFVVFNAQKDYYEKNYKKYVDLSKKYNVPNINLHTNKVYDLEEDRSFGKSMCEDFGVKATPNIDTLDMGQLEAFIKKHKDVVFKSNSPKCCTYIPFSKEEALDIIHEDSLSYLKNKSCILEKKINGKELCVGGYFNGTGWVGNVVVFDQEYKQLLEGDTSNILTGEVGTVFKLVKRNKVPKAVDKILNRLESYLIENDYRGYIDLNCIKPSKGAPMFMEFTCREGFPTQFVAPYICSNYGDLYADMAGLKKVKVKEGYYTCVCLNSGTCCSQMIYNNILPTSNKFVILGADKNCMPMKAEYSKNGRLYHRMEDRQAYIVGYDKDFEKSKEKAYKSIKKIKTFLLQYRKDIGCNWVEPEQFFVEG